MRREHRLRASADFRRARARRQSWAHPLLVLYVAPNDLGHPRLGVSVSRRVGKAVVRNRARRRVSEAVRARLAELAGFASPGSVGKPSPGDPPGRGVAERGAGVDLVFIARDPSARADWPSVRGAVDELLGRARLLPPTPASP